MQLLADFQQRWRTWHEDVVALIRDADAATLSGHAELAAEVRVGAGAGRARGRGEREGANGRGCEWEGL